MPGRVCPNCLSATGICHPALSADVRSLMRSEFPHNVVSIYPIDVMKKILTLVACCTLATLGSAYAQLVPRTVLLEEGTNWSCGPCKLYNPNVDKFLAAHEGSVIHLAYHPNWPGADDPMYLNDQTDNQYRVATYYSISGVPSVVFDGGTSYVPGYVEQLEASFEERFSVGSPVAIQVTHTSDGQNATVHVAIHPVQDLSSYKQLYLRVAAVEDWVDGPGPNGEAKYVHAMREMMPSYKGKLVKLTSRDTSFDYTYEIRPDYTADRMYEVAFLQNDATKEVLQAATDKPGFALAPAAGERWITRVQSQQPTSVNLALSNTTSADENFDITYTPTSTNQWPLTINDKSADVVQHVTVTSSGSLPLQIKASPGTGAYMSGYITVSSTVGGEKLQSVFPVKFIAPDVKLALVDVGADSIRSAPVISTMDGMKYYYVPLTSGEISVMDGWHASEFPELVVEGNKWIVTGSTKTAITNYMNEGGHMLLHGGEIAFGLADGQSAAADRDPAFLRNVLHASYVKDSAGPTTVHGVADDAVSNPFATTDVDIYALNTDAPNQPDEITPYNGSLPIFYYGSGTSQVAGIRWEQGHSRMVYLAFGLQNLATSDQSAILKNSIDWLQSPYSAVKLTATNSLEFTLYPNPVSQNLTVSYSTAESGPVSITIVDAAGRVAATLLDGYQNAGNGVARFNVGSLAKGAYLCILRTSSGSVVRPIAVE